MKNRVISLLLVSVMLLSFCSCTRKAPVTVNGTKLDKGIYTYFVDLAKSEEPSASENKQKELAYQKISQYVAINSEFQNKNLTLSVAQKTQLSEDVNTYWQYFSSYYEALGVTKQDYYKIKTSEYYRESLMSFYYSKDGESPVTDKELKSYFSENFVAFRAVTGFLTTVDSKNNTVSLNKKERAKAIEAFSKMADDINEGTAGIELAASYYENSIITNETVVIGKSSTDYPDGFFEQAMKIKNDKAGSFVIGDYVFAVQRNDINSEDLNLFVKYKADCLKALKGEEFDRVVEYWSKYYIVEE